MSIDIEDRDPFQESPRAFLVAVRFGTTPADVVEEHLDELDGLTTAAGGRVVGRAIQRRRAPEPATFIGKGKAEEIALDVADLRADLVIFDDDLSASQVKALEKVLEAAVMDRSALILEIFHQRARTREARTQVELARMRYLLPRLTRRWSHLSRQVGGIGVRGGEGESQLEADRRMLRNRIGRLERQLDKVERSRKVQRKRRRDTYEIALAGYTNAGKSTLFNRLTGARTLVKDQVFATLDSKLRRGHLVGGREVVFADTVGFIRKLPHHLVASFRSTLEEVVEADLVLHVVDRHHPHWRDQQRVGCSVLSEMEIEAERIVLVHNKIDLVAAGEARHPEALHVSAVTGEGIEELRLHLARRLFGDRGIPEWARLAAEHSPDDAPEPAASKEDLALEAEAR
ncbi:MAG: GTPase HflX [Holophagales bacterium]|nr:GTPase HflX [Holophagales bacterium]